MSDTAPAPAPAVKPKRGGGMAKIALIGLAFTGGAAAGGAGAGVALASLGGLPGAKPAATAAPRERAKLDYVEIDTAFTSNLTDTGRYLQLRIAVSTTGGPGVVAALGAHKPAVVSAVLGVLGDLAENDIAGHVAKARLKLQLRDAIDTVLRQKAGTGGIDEVFLTSLVVQ